MAENHSATSAALTYLALHGEDLATLCPETRRAIARIRFVAALHVATVATPQDASARVDRLCAEVERAAADYRSAIERLRADDLIAMACGVRPGAVAP